MVSFVGKELQECQIQKGRWLGGAGRSREERGGAWRSGEELGGAGMGSWESMGPQSPFRLIQC